MPSTSDRLEGKIKLTHVSSLAHLRDWRASLPRSASVAVVYLHGRDSFNWAYVRRLFGRWLALVLVLYDARGSRATEHLVRSVLLSRHMADAPHSATEVVVYVPMSAQCAPTLAEIGDLRLGAGIISQALSRHAKADYAATVETYVRLCLVLRPGAVVVGHADAEENGSVHAALSVLFCRTCYFTCADAGDALGLRKDLAMHTAEVGRMDGISKRYNHGCAGHMGFHGHSAPGTWIACPLEYKFMVRYRNEQESSLYSTGCAEGGAKTRPHDRGPAAHNAPRQPACLIGRMHNRLVAKDGYSGDAKPVASVRCSDMGAVILSLLNTSVWAMPSMSFRCLADGSALRPVECARVARLKDARVFSLSVCNGTATLLYAFCVADGAESPAILVRHRSPLGN